MADILSIFILPAVVFGLSTILQAHLRYQENPLQ